MNDNGKINLNIKSLTKDDILNFTPFKMSYLSTSTPKLLDQISPPQLMEQITEENTEGVPIFGRNNLLQLAKHVGEETDPATYKRKLSFEKDNSVKQLMAIQGNIKFRKIPVNIIQSNIKDDCRKSTKAIFLKHEKPKKNHTYEKLMTQLKKQKPHEAKNRKPVWRVTPKGPKSPRRLSLIKAKVRRSQDKLKEQKKKRTLQSESLGTTIKTSVSTNSNNSNIKSKIREKGPKVEYISKCSTLPISANTKTVTAGSTEFYNRKDAKAPTMLTLKKNIINTTYIIEKPVNPPHSPKIIKSPRDFLFDQARNDKRNDIRKQMLLNKHKVTIPVSPKLGQRRRLNT